MEGVLVLIGLTMLAVPVAVVYLLIKAAALQRSVNILNSRLDDLATGQQPSSPQPDRQSSTLTDELRRAQAMDAAQTEPEPQPAPAPPPEPPKPAAPPPAAAHANSGNVASTSRPTIRPPEVKPHKPDGPDIGDKIGQFIKDYFTEGNPIVRVGVIVLFFGVAFLLKYAAEHDLLPPELRLAGIAAGGLVLLLIGWRLRERRRNYALVMQGGGIGVLYLTMYAALRLYHLLPPAVVIIVMLVMVALAAALAVLQNAPSLAVLAAIGGFLAPVLTSTGQGSHIVLFSYYLLLNAGILLVAWFKSWRLLNLVGFAFTFVIGTAWGVLRYQPEHYFSAQGFLIAFFLFYVALALLYARRQPPALRGLVDGTLVFGTPLIAFSLQGGLVHGIEYGLAWSSMAVGAFYLLLAVLCWRIGKANYRLLSEAWLALGVIFASLTIPFALDGNGIAAAWALEGAGILWVSIRQRHRLGVVFGILLQFAGGIALLAEHTLKGGAQPVFNDVFIGAFMVAVAGVFSSYCLYRHYRDARTWQYQAGVGLLLWGLAWWFGNGVTEINEYRHQLVWLNDHNAIVAFAAISAAVLAWLESRLDWRILRHTVTGLVLALAVLLLGTLADTPHPFHAGGYVVWPLALAVLYAMLRRRDVQSGHGDAAGSMMLPYLHTAAAVMLTTLLTAEAHWLVGDYWGLVGGWHAVAFALPAMLVIAVILQADHWPAGMHPALYRYRIAGLLLVYLLVWSFMVNIHDISDALPLMYLPLINPVDIVQALVLLLMLVWWRGLPPLPAWRPYFVTAAAALVFVWLNAVLLRTLHHWANVPYSLDGFFESALTQACLSIFWTLLGLSVMVWASRRQWRTVWIAAAALLGVVVVKLFSVDLADSNTLESIFSFIVVGVLLLVIGYYSPIPPARQQQAG